MINELPHIVKRTLAYLIDCALIYSIVMLLIQWALLSNIRESIGITDQWFKNSWNMELYVLVSISLPVWLYFTLFDSNKTKGSIGKRILGLSVKDLANQSIQPGKSFVRTAFKLAPWEISHIGIVFPSPIYFEDEPGIRILIIVGILLFLSYLISIMLNSNDQAIYDRIVGTKVIER